MRVVTVFQSDGAGPWQLLTNGEWDWWQWDSDSTLPRYRTVTVEAAREDFDVRVPA
jgi:hypothetical protein